MKDSLIDPYISKIKNDHKEIEELFSNNELFLIEDNDNNNKKITSSLKSLDHNLKEVSKIVKSLETSLKSEPPQTNTASTKAEPIATSSSIERRKQMQHIIVKLERFDKKKKEFHDKVIEERDPIKNQRYLDAEGAVTRISDGLHVLINQYIDGTIDTLDNFKQQVKEGINDEDVRILKTHRGYRQMVLNVLIAIATLGGSLLYGAIMNKYSLFENTDSGDRLEQIHTAIKNPGPSNN